MGTFFVKTEENATQKSLLRSLRTGTYLAAALSAAAAAPLTWFVLGDWGVYAAILCGLVGGCAIGYFTEYYTSDTYKPTQKLAAAAETGSATVSYTHLLPQAGVCTAGGAMVAGGTDPQPVDHLTGWPAEDKRNEERSLALKIVIVGNGKVGFSLAEQLVREK